MQTQSKQPSCAPSVARILCFRSVGHWNSADNVFVVHSISQCEEVVDERDA
jgi:hypothetical protein